MNSITSSCDAVAPFAMSEYIGNGERDDKRLKASKRITWNSTAFTSWRALTSVTRVTRLGSRETYRLPFSRPSGQESTLMSITERSSVLFGLRRTQFGAIKVNGVLDDMEKENAPPDRAPESAGLR